MPDARGLSFRLRGEKRGAPLPECQCIAKRLKRQPGVREVLQKTVREMGLGGKRIPAAPAANLAVLKGAREGPDALQEFKDLIEHLEEEKWPAGVRPAKIDGLRKDANGVGPTHAAVSGDCEQGRRLLELCGRMNWGHRRWVNQKAEDRVRVLDGSPVATLASYASVRAWAFYLVLMLRCGVRPLEAGEVVCQEVLLRSAKIEMAVRRKCLTAAGVRASLADEGGYEPSIFIGPRGKRAGAAQTANKDYILNKDP